ncbi:MAG: 2,3-bisphosphoglycerate-independent phosphoglycerate mutase [Cystobacterineae bacterium]|nr:2,3-bisphosphoglycerate-independent phosphoglycerate mutase [Cystobacterineae bacterium]
MRAKHRVLLTVLDGWGIRPEREFNAIATAGTPEIDRLWQNYPHTHLIASGNCVGLPEGQMGNSEVGHTNIGAGRIVYQDLVRINRACQLPDGLLSIPVFKHAMDKAKADGRALHLLGLVSDGGVHASTEHLKALLLAAKRVGLPRVYVHVFTDGRDTPPQSAPIFVAELEAFMKEQGVGKIATLGGRFWGMDRDKRWERVQKAFVAIVKAEGPKAPNALAAIAQSHAENVHDEFIVPTVIAQNNGEPVAKMEDGDVAVFFNFRSDRARELTSALAYPSFAEFHRGPLRLGQYVCMTQYDETFTDLPTAFAPNQPTSIFPELVSQAGLRQYRSAETEKYAHVTFFFNGGREALFPGEERLLVPSPRDVKTYDLKPEMSAHEVTQELLLRLESTEHAFALVNLANGDMVGHTGVWEASLQAVRVVDTCIGKIAKACEKFGWVLALTADHGNIEMMVDPLTGQPHTAHTLNPVPFHLVHPELRGQKLRPGVLADIAPTLCRVMGLQQPKEMDCQGLFA